MNLGLTIAVVRYLLILPLSWAATLLAYFFAPIAALPAFVRIGISGREYLVWPWQWLTTHDAPVDSFFIDAYFTRSFLLGRFTREQILASAFLRYVGRVMWIWRNPAYQVSHWLGYDQTGVDTKRGLYKDYRWDTGKPNRALWRVKNKKGQTGFLAQGQLYCYKNWCIEYQFGWKLYRRDADQWCMLALRLSPFKRYP